MGPLWRQATGLTIAWIDRRQIALDTSVCRDFREYALSALRAQARRRPSSAGARRVFAFALNSGSEATKIFKWIKARGVTLAAVSAVHSVMRRSASRYTQATATVPTARKHPDRGSSRSWGSQVVRCDSAARPDSSDRKPRAAGRRCAISVRFAAAWCSAASLARPPRSRSTRALSTTRRRLSRGSRSLRAAVHTGRSFRPG